MPQATSTGSALALGCILKNDPSRYRSSRRTPVRSRRHQVSNSARSRWQIRLTVVLLIVASSPKTSASIASTSRSDRPRTQQEMTSVSSALVRLTPCPNSWSHSAAWAWRSFGRCTSTGPSEVLSVRGCCQPLR
jgi:hypothetical protein